MKNMKLVELVFEYTDDSGSISNIPRRCDKIDTPEGELEVKEATSMCRYTDGGSKPFTVKVRCWPKHA